MVTENLQNHFFFEFFIFNFGFWPNFTSKKNTRSSKETIPKEKIKLGLFTTYIRFHPITFPPLFRDFSIHLRPHTHGHWISLSPLHFAWVPSAYPFCLGSISLLLFPRGKWVWFQRDFWGYWLTMWLKFDQSQSTWLHNIKHH